MPSSPPSFASKIVKSSGKPTPVAIKGFSFRQATGIRPFRTPYHVYILSTDTVSGSSSISISERCLPSATETPPSANVWAAI